MKVKEAVLLLSVLFLAVSCGGPRWEDTTLSENTYYNVRIQHLVEDKQATALQYSHPVDVDAQVIARFLGDLKYSEKHFLTGEDRQTPVFQQIEIDRLAPSLAEAFGNVGENQRIAFTSFNKGGGLVFEKRRRTDGVMFVDEDNRLNAAFSGINVEIIDDEREKGAFHQTAEDPLDAMTSKTPLVTEKAYMQARLRENGKPYPMWMAADLTALKKETKTRAGHAADFTPPEDPEMHREYIRSQLAYIKGLYDDGLISEQEYNEKRKELIDAIR
jgi:hypothetical protein